MPSREEKGNQVDREKILDIYFWTFWSFWIVHFLLFNELCSSSSDFNSVNCFPVKYCIIKSWWETSFSRILKRMKIKIVNL
jgi:hypothetical protein